MTKSNGHENNLSIQLDQKRNPGSPTEFENKQYDSQMIIESLVNPSYAKERQEEIESMEKLISEGFNVESAKTFLKKLQATPPGPILDPSEPRGLAEAVYCRIEVLKFWLLQDDFDKTQKINVEAILRAYREGNLQVVPGMVSFWKGGEMKRGLGDDLPDDEMVDLMTKWSEEGPPGAHWTEDPQVYDEIPNTAAYSPYNEHGQHTVGDI